MRIDKNLFKIRGYPGLDEVSVVIFIYGDDHTAKYGDVGSHGVTIYGDVISRGMPTYGGMAGW